MPIVTHLQVAPVKALSTVPRDRVLVDADGVAEDRRLFLLDARGAVVTQRRTPALTRVVPDLDLAAGTLTVHLPDGSTATTGLADAGERVEARLFGKDRAGRLLPGAVADALSEVTGAALRLVLADRAGVGWDEGPVSLIGRASAAAVGTPETHGEPTMRRYRMLVEVDGTAAYEEESWLGERIAIGEALLSVGWRLERCVVINVDPQTGTKDWSGVQRLAEVRGADRITLGVIAEVVRPGWIAVGDEVVVAPAG